MWKHTKVQGFLMPNEAIVLYDLAKSIKNPSPVLVEIGSWIGKSSIVIASAIQGDARLFCVDPFDGSADMRGRYKQLMGTMDKSLQEVFIQNIKQAGLANLIVPIKGYSHQVVKGWDKPIDFLFIDGDHSYKAVKRDYLDWGNYIVDGGWIAFHDTHFQCPPGMKEYKKGPGLVIQEYIQSSDEWSRQTLIGTLYIAQKKALCV